VSQTLHWLVFWLLSPYCSPYRRETSTESELDRDFQSRTFESEFELYHATSGGWNAAAMDWL